MHLKNGRSTGKGAYTCKGTTLRVMFDIRPKVNFLPNGCTKEVYWWPAINQICKIYSKE
jgi:hypothetical protein